jgi:6-phosphogluconolactonase/glucosamine-6-phosphate isomerase/deaminase
VTAEYIHQVSMWRATLTAAVINAAAEVVFHVSGDAKSSIVRKVLQGPNRPHELPAQVIAPIAGRALWLLDAPAAAGLERDPG